MEPTPQGSPSSRPLGLAVLFIVYYGFNKTQGTDRDYLLNTHHAELETL